MTEETDVAVVGVGPGSAILPLAVVALLRDRVFQSYQVLSTAAGLRTVPPFNIIDRVIAAGFLPDVRSKERSPHPMSM